jgi:hypothetical protein
LGIEYRGASFQAADIEDFSELGFLLRLLRGVFGVLVYGIPTALDSRHLGLTLGET